MRIDNRGFAMSFNYSSCLSGGFRAVRTLILLGGLAIVTSASATAVCHVTTAGNSAADGSDWTQAMNLQTALADSTTCPEVWVAAGVYTPVTPATPGTPTGAERTISFSILPGVEVYGGFVGIETQRSDRDPATNVTTLSGDLNGDDGPNFANYGDNSLHVLYLDGTSSAGNITASTVLDGFTISGGNARGSAPPDIHGGGLLCNGNANGHECSPALSNLTFSANSAAYGGAMFNSGKNGTSSPRLVNVIFNGNSAKLGGAMLNSGYDGGTSNPSLTNVTFSGNSATERGGAIFNDGVAGTSSPTLNNVTFNTNSAQLGGGMFNNSRASGTSSPTLRSVTFSDNSATLNGGGINNHSDDNGTTSPILENVTFSNNTAQQGGAMINLVNGDGTSIPVLRNVTFNGNSAGSRGGAMYNISTTIGTGTNNPSLSNVIAWGNTATTGKQISNAGGATATIDHSVIEGGCTSSDGNTCTNVITVGPNLYALADNGGLTLTMLPGSGSSAIDAGDNSTCPATDQRGITRPQGAVCDIGAVEVSIVIFRDGFEL